MSDVPVIHASSQGEGPTASARDNGSLCHSLHVPVRLLPRRSARSDLWHETILFYGQWTRRRIFTLCTDHCMLRFIYLRGM